MTTLLFRKKYFICFLVFLREDNFGDCISLGKELLSRNHYASNEIKDKLVELTNMRNEMLHRWEERWEHLQVNNQNSRFSLFSIVSGIKFLCNIFSSSSRYTNLQETQLLPRLGLLLRILI